MADPQLEIEIGPHKGWTRYLFDLADRPWSLLTIDRDDDRHSLLSPRDEQRSRPWPCYHIERYEGLLTPQAAFSIIRQVKAVFEDGRVLGRAEKAASIRKALEDA